MDLRQLRYFVALATQGHYGRAAAVLHIAQPALSRQIHLLEEELGVRLFERHARGATPTPDALLLLERANFLLRYAEQTRDDMLARRREPKGQVSIGLSPALALLLAVPLTRALREAYPAVRLRLVEAFSQSLLEMLEQGAVDAAVLNGPMQLEHLTVVPLMTEALCLVGLATDPRLRARSIRLQQLAGVPLILTGIAKSGVRLQTEAAAARAGVALQAVVEVETPMVAMQLVEDRIGLTVHFAAGLQAWPSRARLKAVPIEGLGLRRVLAHAANRPPSRATQVVMETLRRLVAEAIAEGRWPNAESLERVSPPRSPRP